jgi:hypothetical protein
MQSKRNNSVLKEDKAKRLAAALRQNLVRRKVEKGQEKGDEQRQRPSGFEDQTP